MMMVVATANTRDVITIPMATPTPTPVYNQNKRFAYKINRYLH